MNSTQKPGKIFDWVNSIDLPSCKLASSVEDLKSGIVLCDIAAYIKSRPLFEGVKRHKAQIYSPQSSSIHNFNLFFKEIGSKASSSLECTPEELYNRPERVIPILEFLKTLLPAEERKVHRRVLSSFEKTRSSPNSEGFDTIFQWLRSLNLAPSDPANLIEHLKDGTVLCLLIKILEGNKEALKGYPKSKATKKTNVIQALAYLEKTGKPVCNIFDFLNGNPEVIINFLLELKASYTRKAKKIPKAKCPDNVFEISKPYNRNYLRNRNMSVKNISVEDKFHDTREIDKENSIQNDLLREREREKEIVKQWAKKLGLNDYMNNDCIYNGVLVAEIIKIVEHISIPGIYYNPRSLSEARSNFKLALNALRYKNREIALKYTQVLDLLLRGETVWNLLKSLMSAYSTKPRDNSDFREIVLWVNSFGLIQVQSFEELVKYIQEGPLLCDLVQTCLKSGMLKINRNPRTKEDRINNLEEVLFALQQHPRISEKFLNIQRILEGNEQFIYELVNALRKISISDMYTMTRMENLEPVSSVEDMASTRQNFSPKYNKSSWICNILGISDLDLDKEYSPEFSNGILLCELLNKLGRADIHINYSPKSQASALHNIEKALQVLRKKASFPSELFFVEEDILRGNSEIIRQVLTHIHGIYKMNIHTRCKSSKDLRPKF